MATQRTVEEAKAYINESIAYWESTKDENQLKKINSLANWAEKWRSSKTTPRQYMRDLLKNINGVETVIKRKLKLNPKNDVIALQKELESTKKLYDSMVERHGELPPKKTKKKE